MSFRDGSFNNLKVPLTWAAAAAIVLALAAAVALAMTDRGDTLEATTYGPVREVADQVQKPVSGVLSTPGRWVDGGVKGVRGYFFAVSENRRLKRQLQQMNDLKAELALQKDLNSRYVALLGLRIDPPVPMVSGRMISDSRGPFANFRLIDIGSDAGVKVGNPVMSENGLVGRVVGVAAKVSRVLLLTDPVSRTPVMIDRTNARAILTGDGGPNPKMMYLRTSEAPKAGDLVVTSGDGGLVPRGLPVGVAVQGLDRSWRVRLASDRGGVDYVRVLKFEDFSQLADLAKLSEVVKPDQMGGRLPTPAASAPPKAAIPVAVVAPAAKTVSPPVAPAKTAAVAPARGGVAVAPQAKALTPAPPGRAATPPVTPPKAAIPQAAAPKAAAPLPAGPAPAPPKASVPKAETSYERAVTPDRPPVATTAAPPPPAP